MLNALLNIRFGAWSMSKMPFSDFLLSSGWRLELILATTPTNVIVAEESTRACSSGESPVTCCVSTAGTLSAMASESVEGSLGLSPTTAGYANEAKRNGRGMRSAVRASGKSSQELLDCQPRYRQDR